MCLSVFKTSWNFLIASVWLIPNCKPTVVRSGNCSCCTATVRNGALGSPCVVAQHRRTKSRQSNTSHAGRHHCYTAVNPTQMTSPYKPVIRHPDHRQRPWAKSCIVPAWHRVHYRAEHDFFFLEEVKATLVHICIPWSVLASLSSLFWGFLTCGWTIVVHSRSSDRRGELFSLKSPLTSVKVSNQLVNIQEPRATWHFLHDLEETKVKA